jgi:asparagine synthase (glutamine-hydrolysing)
MCGICGKLNFDRDARVDPAVLKRMLDFLRHRGPDDEGMYLQGPVGLGNRRLSIIDLNTGHQPISNEDGTLWIVLNGEIYNYRELRSYLLSKGHSFKTQTDTEVIVHLYEEHGPDCVEKLRGMFAFAVWDEKKRTLFVVRDRVGIKPLYYSVTDKSLVFASEVKGILGDPTVKREIAPEIIDRFLTFHYLPGEETLFRGISKLSPGTYLLAREGKVEIHQYWDLCFSKAIRNSRPEAVEEQLRSLLAESVGLHMIADVPVGVLLSGGIDSTAVLGMAMGYTDKRIGTYTIGFCDPVVPDERPYARMAAEAFGAQYHEMTISPNDFADFMPKYVWHMEEPVCEPPAIAMYYVSKLARKDVKVLLSGEGGDEAFAGYSNYRNISWLERLKGFLGPVIHPAAYGLTVVNKVLHSSKIAKYAPLMTAPFPDYYLSRTSTQLRFSRNGVTRLYNEEFARSLDRQQATMPLQRLLDGAKGYSVVDQMLYIDTKTWLPDDLLIKADKMTMANSLELRVPLLDHKVLEFAAALPSHYKVRGFTTKFIVKRALRDQIPEPILKRRKAGFPVPYEGWLRNDLRDWVRDVLFDPRTKSRGYFEPKAVEELLRRDQQTGRYAKEVFCLLTLELWQREFLEQPLPVCV